jgi:NDP-sugar pyrophosphorylase family protein
MQAVILAAGKSERFWPLNKEHKACFQLMGKPLIFWCLRGIEKIRKIKEVLIVQSPKRDIEECLKNFKFNFKIKFLIQRKPLGMGNALWQAKKFLKDYFFILNGDVLNSDEILKSMIEKFEKEKKSILAGQRTKNPQIFGMLKLKGNRILKLSKNQKREKNLQKLKPLGFISWSQNFSISTKK